MEPIDVQVGDVVRVLSTNQLALVEHIGGETTSDEIDSVDIDNEWHANYQNIISSNDTQLSNLRSRILTDHGHATHGLATARRHLIHQYDEDEDEVVEIEEKEDDEFNDSIIADIATVLPREDTNTPPEIASIGDPGLAENANCNNAEDPSSDVPEYRSRDVAPPSTSETADGSLPSPERRQTGSRWPASSENDTVPFGSVGVSYFLTGEPLVLPFSNFKVEDRSFHIGDIVSRRPKFKPALNDLNAVASLTTGDVGGMLDQAATVVAVRKFLTVREPIPFSYRAHATRITREQPTFTIPAECLSFITPFREGVYVVRGNWLGRVVVCVEFVYVSFPDGSVCQVRSDGSGMRPEYYEDVAVVDFVEGFFYPGVYVNACPAFWASARWLKGSFSGVTRGVVRAVRPDYVQVEWIAVRCKHDHNSPEETPPPSIVPALDLTLLSTFQHLSWQVGDRGCFHGKLPKPPLSEEDKIIHCRGDGGVSSNIRCSAAEVRAKEESERLTQTSSPLQGMPCFGLKITSKVPSDIISCPWALDHDCQIPDSAMNGGPCVLEIVQTKTYLDVVWQDGSTSCDVPAFSMLRREYLGDFDFFPGMFVSKEMDDFQSGSMLNVAKENQDATSDGKARKNAIGVIVRAKNSTRTAVVRWQQGDGKSYGTEEPVSVYELSGNLVYDVQLCDVVLRIPPTGNSPHQTNFNERADWVGTVIGVGIGVVEVQWHKGTRETHSPENLLVVRDEEEDEDVGSMDESIEVDEMASEADVLNNSIRNIHGSANQSPHTAELVRTADLTENWTEDQDHVLEPSTKFNLTSNDQNSGAQCRAGDLLNMSSALTEDPNGQTGCLNNFVVVDDLSSGFFPSDHSAEYARLPKFPSIVRKEWTLLGRHLPAGIFVHSTESRMDLLRTAIIGASGTPYAHALFFFDISLPSDYPNRPPKVMFHSHNRRLNPNLYEDGKVCLSILGTWDGDGVEKWDPCNSNVLRVLLSLQAMVFVDEPYYNEAGYERQRGTSEGCENSRLYNESAFLLSLKHVLSSLRPGGVPADFKEFAIEHYRTFGPNILTNCHDVVRDFQCQDSSPCGRDVDSLRHHDNGGTAIIAKCPSDGLKQSLRGLIPLLEAAFSALQ